MIAVLYYLLMLPTKCSRAERLALTTRNSERLGSKDGSVIMCPRRGGRRADDGTCPCELSFLSLEGVWELVHPIDARAHRIAMHPSCMTMAAFGGLAGATLVVAATTIDDAVWLVPYTTSPKLTAKFRVLHGALFVLTLEMLAGLCCLTAQAVFRIVGEQDDWIFGVIGAILCWIIAATLYVKKLLKRRRRQQAEQRSHHDASSEPQSTEGYGTIPVDLDATQEQDEPHITFAPWTVISLTFLGALDEISYFPALLVGGVFTWWELCLGTFFAACLILVIISLFLSQCQPLIKWLDSIPLYGIVGMFAIALTIGVIVDLWKEESLGS